MSTKDQMSAIQQLLGYSEEEAHIFLSDPARAQVATRAPELYNKLIVAEVIESHGCIAQHHTGDCLYFNGFGHLLVQKNSKDVCVFALHALASLVFAANELHYADVDPNKMCFKNVGCLDVGVRCGGVGHVTFSFRMEDQAE
jgi:uncharacterized repeat protein (TIGR04076 family)